MKYSIWTLNSLHRYCTETSYFLIEFDKLPQLCYLFSYIPIGKNQICGKPSQLEKRGQSQTFLRHMPECLENKFKSPTTIQFRIQNKSPPNYYFVKPEKNNLTKMAQVDYS